MAAQDGPVFFVSYARQDVDSPGFSELLRTFVVDVEARVAQDLGRARQGVAFFEVNDIHTGEQWSPALGEALERCAVGLPLFSASYFAREWCGKEFQVFLDRTGPGLGQTGIVPVRWSYKLPALPDCAARIQYTDDTFPPDYKTLGMQQLMTLRGLMPGRYELAIHALANRIVEAATTKPLRPIDGVDLDQVVSAWSADTAADPQSHTKGGISKTCFVYIARAGWDWKPYGSDATSVGAMAQQISGELGLRYEEMPCDAALTDKLKAANDNDVPTVLFGDPGSFADARFAQPMREYDKQYLLNCATLVAWDGASKETLDADPQWIELKKVCRQKIADPPPNHDWRSIFSRAELETRTRLTIETIRSRLMKQLMSEPSGTGASAARKAVDTVASAEAALQGISTGTPAQLANSLE